MRTIVWHVLKESFHRTMGLALLAVSALFAGMYMWGMRITTGAGSDVTVKLGSISMPAADFARDFHHTVIQLTTHLWLWIGLFAAAPLLTSVLEKGWAEMLFSKGQPRWKWLAGRILGVLCLFVASLTVFAGFPAVRLWIASGIGSRNLVLGLLILLLSYASLLSIMALAAMASSHFAAPLMAGFVQLIVSEVLFARDQALYPLITARWARWLLDWAYRILPKNPELGREAARFVATGQLSSWWPLWTTAVFIVCALTLATFKLDRKEF